MGCGVSSPETDEGGGKEEGGNFRQHGSMGKDSAISDSLTSNKEHLEMSTQSKKSKTDSEITSKEEEEEEEEDECKNEEEKGDELKISPASPSFRIYCVFPRDPNDENVVDDNHDMQGNKYITDETKDMKGKKQEAVGMKIRRRFNNVKKLLIPPTPPSSAAS